MKLLSKIYIPVTLSIVLLLSSCATHSTIKSPYKTQVENPESVINHQVSGVGNQASSFEYKSSGIKHSVSSQVISRPLSKNDLIEKELKRIMREFGEDDEVPQVFLDEVKVYVNRFQSNNYYRNFVKSSLRRSSEYMLMVKGILGKKGIPGDMAYIAFIESGFNPNAKSRAGAVGMWQFMPATARDYSLRVNWRADDRRDPVRSTHAAANYFQDLLSIFGPRSFLLAMAAYNAGEGRVMSCLKKIDNPLEHRSFWHIRSCLAKETREYPPKIIASAIIGNNPEAFGFPRYEDLTNKIILAGNKKEGISEARKVNKASYVKPKRKKIVSKSVRSNNTNKDNNRKAIIYSVKRGNTLSSIARAFEIKTSDIEKWNNLKTNQIVAGHKLKIYPKGTLAKITYRVRKGDTISGIGRKFNVQPASILTVNGIQSRWRIRVGQTLTFYKRIRNPYSYTVKSGANLTYISEAFNVSVDDIIKWNKLESTTIFPGQKLKIYPSGLRDI